MQEMCSGQMIRPARYYPRIPCNTSSPWELDPYEFSWINVDEHGNTVLWRGDCPDDPIYVQIVDPKTAVNFYEETTPADNLQVSDGEVLLWQYTPDVNERLYIGSLNIWGNMAGRFILKINGITQGKYPVGHVSPFENINMDKYPIVVEASETVSIYIERTQQIRPSQNIPGEFGIQIRGNLINLIE